MRLIKCNLIIFLILTTITATIIEGCISGEDEGVKISGDIGLSVGSAEKDQADIQKIQWTVSIANTGSRTAENVRGEFILHPFMKSKENIIGITGERIYIKIGE